MVLMPPLTVKHINPYEDNLNWAAFRVAGKDNLRDVEINEVNNMLSCKDESRGFFTYEWNTVESQKSLFRMQRSHLHELWHNPHIHILVTEGGFDRHGRFIHQKCIPFNAMRKTKKNDIRVL
ncbi:MAG: transposase [Halobacteriota archaeon]